MLLDQGMLGRHFCYQARELGLEVVIHVPVGVVVGRKQPADAAAHGRSGSAGAGRPEAASPAAAADGVPESATARAQDAGAGARERQARAGVRAGRVLLSS